MKIGIFSKLIYPGGSEFRCVELANQFARNNHDVYLLGEGEINEKVSDKINSNVKPFANILAGSNKHKPLDLLYDLDSLFIINSDSKNFTTANYWLGLSEKHGTKVELNRIKQMNYIFNFLISPSIALSTIKPFVDDIRILTTNSKFFKEVSEQERYKEVRHYPRMIIESPIDPESVIPIKSKSKQVRLGMHSLPVESKWNQDFPKLIKELNKEYDVQWDFLGMPKKLGEQIKAKNVNIRKEFSIPVKEYLSGIDVFTFFGSYNREEPWSRAVAEALTSGCPVLANNRGGNIDQIIHGNNGFLCSNYDEFKQSIKYLLDKPEILRAQRCNALRASKTFSSQQIINRLLEFIK